MGTYGERNPVVAGEDDELGSDVGNPDVAEDDGVLKGDFPGHWRRGQR